MSETKTVTEYRAFDKAGGFGLFTWVGYPRPPFGVDEEIAGARLRGRDIQIEGRQVTYGPWTAVEEG